MDIDALEKQFNAYKETSVNYGDSLLNTQIYDLSGSKNEP